MGAGALGEGARAVREGDRWSGVVEEVRQPGREALGFTLRLWGGDIRRGPHGQGDRRRHVELLLASAHPLELGRGGRQPPRGLAGGQPQLDHARRDVGRPLRRRRLAELPGGLVEPRSRPFEIAPSGRDLARDGQPEQRLTPGQRRARELVDALLRRVPVAELELVLGGVEREVAAVRSLDAEPPRRPPAPPP